MPDLRLLLIADDPLARTGLGALLSDQRDMQVVGQSETDVDLNAVVAAFLPDVVIWDLGWEPADRMEALNQFTDAHDLPVIAMLSTADLAGATRAAQVRGLLGRGVDGSQLAAAARCVFEGLLVFDEEMVTMSQPTSGADRLVEPLSARELDVLRGMAEGMPNKQIARYLEISEHTVKFHVNAILGKLGAQSRTEAVVRATRARPDPRIEQRPHVQSTEATGTKRRTRPC